MLQEEEEGRAATERLHELANLPKKKARKEGQKLTEDQKKARAREYARKAREKKKQAKEAGGAQEYQHDDMEAEEEHDDTFGVAAYPPCDASMPLSKGPRLPPSDLPPNPCDGSEEMSEGANE